MRIDHVVIVVPTLEEAAALFRAAGFVVLPGGVHEELPTANALVALADGSYLELLACREPETRVGLRALRGTPRWGAHLAGVSAIARRFLPRLAGPDGVADYALLRPRLGRFAAEARRRGFAMSGPLRMRRTRGDGVALDWEMILPADDVLPFLIEDRTARGQRVPGTPEALAHANGATGIAEVVVASPDPAAAALGLGDLVGAPPRLREDGRTELALEGARILLERGGTAGACGVAIAGVRALPAGLAALGLRGA